GNRLAGGVVSLHAELEGLEAALQQVDVVGRINRAHDAAEFADRFELFFAADDDASEQVVVTAEVLCGGVQDIIDTVFERLDVVGRSERGVDQCLNVAAATDVGKTLQIHHAEVRISRRLADEQLRLGVDRGFHRFVVATADLARNDTESRKVLRAEL